MIVARPNIEEPQRHKERKEKEFNLLFLCALCVFAADASI